MIDAHFRIGRGPARTACLRAVEAFERGYALVQDEIPYQRWCADPTGRFFIEGVGAAVHLAQLPLPKLTGLQQHLLELGIGMAIGSQCIKGTSPVLTTPAEASGFGFMITLLRPDATLTRRRRHSLSPALTHSADEGLGRALWFVCAGSAPRIMRLASTRSSHVWRGIGIASSFTGGSPPDTEQLLRLSPHPESFREGHEYAQSVEQEGPAPPL